MKQRTITLKWHHVYGTANTYCLRLLYRGQPVYMITTLGFGVSIDPVTAQALAWATARAVSCGSVTEEHS